MEVMHPIFVNPSGRHTAAVVVPASEGTTLLAALAAHKSEINPASGGDDQSNAGSSQNGNASKPTPVLKGVHMDPNESTTQTGAVASNQPATVQEAQELGSLIRANRAAAAELLGETERIAALEAQAEESEQILIANSDNLLQSPLSNCRLPAPAIVKDSMNKILVQAWKQYGEAGYGWWREIVTVEHFTDLNQIDWVITGTIGSLPTISERGEYPILPIHDNLQTSDWTKYGGDVPLTLEAILRDNLKAFKQFPPELSPAPKR